MPSTSSTAVALLTASTNHNDEDDIPLESLLRDPTVGHGTLLFRDDRPLVRHGSGLPRSPEQPPPPPPPLSPPRTATSSDDTNDVAASTSSPVGGACSPTPKATNVSILPIQGGPTLPLPTPSADGTTTTTTTAGPRLGRAPPSVAQHLHLSAAATSTSSTYGAVEEQLDTGKSSSSSSSSSPSPTTDLNTADPPTESLPLFQHPPPPPTLGGIYSSLDDDVPDERHPPSAAWNEHDFYYTNTDYTHYHHQPYHGSSDDGNGGGLPLSSSSRRHRLPCGSRMYSMMRRCGRRVRTTCQAIRHAEHIHRSVCYGAIDGMLTGSGLVGAFCGLGVVSGHSPSSVHALVVAFALCAGASDALGMALGHVWTTHAASVAQSMDRSAARHHFHRFKADAKGRLVDLLLQRGMLKIDAMSLADTLEGYPDLFVAALAGEGIVGGVGGPTGPGSDEDDDDQQRDCYCGEAGGAMDDRQHDVYFSGAAGDLAHHPSSRRPYFASSPRRRPSSSSQAAAAAATYGGLSDLEMDPDAFAVAQATREARHESLGMVVSFTLFAVLPAWVLGLAWEWSAMSGGSGGGGGGGGSSASHQRYLLPSSGGSALHTSSYSTSSSSVSSLDPHPVEASAAAAPFLTPASLALSVGACVMWVLGVWKSRFFVVVPAPTPTSSGNSGRGVLGGAAAAPHWAWFGTEAVAVFGVCVASAYGLGVLLHHVALSNDGASVVLQAVTSSSSSSTSRGSGIGGGGTASHDDHYWW